jgi:hypothetical protein
MFGKNTLYDFLESQIGLMHNHWYKFDIEVSRTTDEDLIIKLDGKCFVVKK